MRLTVLQPFVLSDFATFRTDNARVLQVERQMVALAAQPWTAVKANFGGLTPKEQCRTSSNPSGDHSDCADNSIGRRA
jgi:hypothetical protein